MGLSGVAAVRRLNDGPPESSRRLFDQQQFHRMRLHPPRFAGRSPLIFIGRVNNRRSDAKHGVQYNATKPAPEAGYRLCAHWS